MAEPGGYAVASQVRYGGRGRELGIPDYFAEHAHHRDMDGVGVRIDPAHHLTCCCHDGASLSVRTDEVRRRLGLGRQDIDETLARLLSGHPRA